MLVPVGYKLYPPLLDFSWEQWSFVRGFAVTGLQLVEFTGDTLAACPRRAWMSAAWEKETGFWSNACLKTTTKQTSKKLNKQTKKKKREKNKINKQQQKNVVPWSKIQPCELMCLLQFCSGANQHLLVRLNLVNYFGAKPTSVTVLVRLNLVNWCVCFNFVPGKKINICTGALGLVPGSVADCAEAISVTGKRTNRRVALQVFSVTTNHGASQTVSFHPAREVLFLWTAIYWFMSLAGPNRNYSVVT